VTSLSAIGLLLVLAACGGTGATATPRSEDAESVFRAFNAAIAAGDEATATALLAEGGQILHQDVTAETVAEIVEGFTCVAEIVTVDGDDETVEVQLRFTGTTPSAAMECGVVGDEESLMVTVRDGQITSIDEAP
jgi:hypothetical protein